ncbi:hypothetical protein K474DRAFT_1710403 [Panus rudis PR-1116 ss-1]|nr:hypothetical protein K474DRAFT_1710403 [Panus rudis PR-1116 ss-1]
MLPPSSSIDLELHHELTTMHVKFLDAIIGPVSTTEFIQVFLHSSSSGLQRQQRISPHTFSRISAQSTCLEIEIELARAVNDHCLCPNYVLERRPDRIDHQTGQENWPPLSLFSLESAPEGSSDWVSLEFFVDVHGSENADPFRRMFHAPRRALRSIDDGALVLFVFGRYVRFLRVDRSGLIVSEAMNYVENPRVLVEFFRRYSFLSRAERGFDPTVIPASLIERRLLTNAVSRHLRTAKESSLRAHPGMLATLAKDYPTWKVAVNDTCSGKPTYYIIRKPCAESPHPLGRATRGFIALKMTENKSTSSTPASKSAHTGKLVFLKDHWRKDGSNLPIESDVHAELEQHGIPHIPTFLGGGDVLVDKLVQKTETPRLLAKNADKWGKPRKPLSTYTHHRLVQELAFPLDTIRNAKELVQAIRDAMDALIETYAKTRRLHRDISTNNILLASSDNHDAIARGLLNDWDVSYKVQANPTNRVQRAGTWRFFSLEVLMDDSQPHKFIHDLEALFWVLLYMSAHYLKHDGWFNIEMFDEKVIRPQPHGPPTVCGGSEKFGFLLHPKVTFRCPALNDLISDLRQFWVRGNPYKLGGFLDGRSKLQKTCKKLLGFFDKALRRGPEDWKDGEVVEDQYPGNRMPRDTDATPSSVDSDSMSSALADIKGCSNPSVPVEDEIVTSDFASFMSAAEDVSQPRSARARKRSRDELSTNETLATQKRRKVERKAEGSQNGNLRRSGRLHNK